MTGTQSPPEGIGVMHLTLPSSQPGRIPIIGILTLVLFIAGVVNILLEWGPAASGPMAVTNGCCYGSLMTMCSIVMLPLVVIEARRSDDPLPTPSPEV